MSITIRLYRFVNRESGVSGRLGQPGWMPGGGGRRLERVEPAYGKDG